MARSWRAAAATPSGVTWSRMRAARPAVISPATPPGISSHSTACRRQATWLRDRARSRCRLAKILSTAAWSSAASCWASMRPSPVAPSAAHVRSGHAAAHASSCWAWPGAGADPLPAQRLPGRADRHRGVRPLVRADPNHHCHQHSPRRHQQTGQTAAGMPYTGPALGARPSSGSTPRQGPTGQAHRSKARHAGRQAALHRIAAASGGLRASRTCTRRKWRGPPGTRVGWVSPADSGTYIVHEIIPDYAQRPAGIP